MKCPKCGKEMKKNQWGGYECDKACGFKLFNPMYGRKMSDSELSILCTEGKLPYMNGFKKKDGTIYSARLKFDNEYKVVLYWEQGDGELKCPKCGRPLKKGSKALGCTGWQEGCDFVIWNTIAEHVLTDKEKEDLVNKGLTNLIRDFKAKSGKTFNAKLKLNENKKIVFEFDKKEAK